MGESAAKNYSGMNLVNSPIKPYTAGSKDLAVEIGKLSSENILRTTLDGVNLRYSGHLSNNSPVPHVYTQ